MSKRKYEALFYQEQATVRQSDQNLRHSQLAILNSPSRLSSARLKHEWEAILIIFFDVLRSINRQIFLSTDKNKTKLLIRRAKCLCTRIFFQWIWAVIALHWIKMFPYLAIFASYDDVTGDRLQACSLSSLHRLVARLGQFDILLESLNS